MPARRGSVTAVSVFVVGLIVWACCVSCLRRPFVGDEVDDGQYLVGAQSLRDGTGYRLTSRVGSPVARKYPPGVSAVTAVGLTLMPGQPSLAKDQAVARAYMLLSTIGLAVACRRLCMLCGLDGWTATLLGLAVPFHPDVVMFSHYLNADLPFAALATWLACRWAGRWQHPGPTPVRSAVLDGVLVAAAMVTRSNGITLVAAGLVAWVPLTAGRRGARVRHVAAYLSTVILLVGAAAALVALQSGARDTGGYRDELVAAYSAARHAWHIPAWNLSRMPVAATSAVWPMTQWATPFFTPPARMGAARVLLVAATTLTMAVGLWTVGLRKLGPAVLTQVALTVAVFTVWHYTFSIRFGLPLVPVVAIAFAIGLGRSIGRRVDPRTAWRAGGLTALAGGLVVLVTVVVDAAHHGGVQGYVTDPQQVAAFDFVRQHTPADAVVICPVPELVYLNAGRQTAPVLDDARGFARLPPTWDTLQRWVRSAAGRPIYFYGERPRDDPKPNAMAAVTRSSPFVIQQVFTSPTGNQWVGRLSEEPKPFAATAPSASAVP